MHFLKLQERGWSRSIHKTSTWTIGGNKSVESTELQDSSSDEEATRRLALAQGQSNSFLVIKYYNKQQYIQVTGATIKRFLTVK